MKYTHSENIHNLNAPNQIIPILIEIFHPQSVIDIGCGIGTFLSAFKAAGVKEVLGVDGAWADKELLSKYLSAGEFREVNLESSFEIKRKYDIAICLEVAEHISKEGSSLLVKNLTSVSDIIIFSAAVPLQGGQNHLNEQWIDFWQEKFAYYDFTFRDGLRQILWDNKFVEPWYKQNIFIIAKSDVKVHIDTEMFTEINNIQTYIHPDIYSIKAAGYQKFFEGGYKTHVYLKLLIKRIFKKVNIDI